MDVSFAARFHMLSQVLPGCLVYSLVSAAVHAPMFAPLALLQGVLGLPVLTALSTPVGPPEGVEGLVMSRRSVINLLACSSFPSQSVCFLITLHTYVGLNFANKEGVS